MPMTLILLWFPIILAVAVAGRLLGATRGIAVGFACALFWVSLVQASVGVGVWHDGWTVMSLIAGSLAIVFMGGWSGQGSTGDPLEALDTADGNGGAPRALVRTDELSCISAAIHQFDEWLADHRDDVDPWPAFGELVRNILHQSCQATHVHPCRLYGDREELVALHASDNADENERRSARHGVAGHVVTSGRPYVAGDPSQGELVHTLAAEDGERIAWCFPITMGTRRLGVVVVGRLELPPEPNRMLLRTIEQTVNQFWCTLHETRLSRSSAQRDPVSGLFTRPAFFRAADSTLRESYRQGEPVALAILAIEGLRDMSDFGRWELADEVSAEMARSLGDKLRTDDRIGRFDDSRFILLLRRVDAELASLIVGQLVTRIDTIGNNASRWGGVIRVRCGLVGSGTEQPELRSLVERALVQARRARETDVAVSIDLPKRRATRPGLPAMTGDDPPSVTTPPEPNAAHAVAASNPAPHPTAVNRKP